jgi:hypothetical protein
MQLTLAHHPKSVGRGAVDGDRERDPPPGGRSLQLDPAQLHARLLAEQAAAWRPSEDLASTPRRTKVLGHSGGASKNRTCDLILIRAPDEDP